MAISGSSSSSSPSAALSPSPGGSVSSAAVAQPVTMPPPVKQRKKPGPKPKPKVQPSHIVKLKIKPSLLSTLKLFAPASSAPATADGTPNGSSPNGTSPQPVAPSIGTADASLLPPSEKRRGIPGPKPGTKRTRAPGVLMAKPGRKKVKLDPNVPGGGLMNGAPHTAHGKPGPKANTGAINDKLRALDRSGRPCKRWNKAGFTLKSFTGVQWTIPTWAAPVAPKTTTETPTENTDSVSADPSIAAETPPEIKIRPDTMFSKPMISASQGIAV